MDNKESWFNLEKDRDSSQMSGLLRKGEEKLRERTEKLTQMSNKDGDTEKEPARLFAQDVANDTGNMRYSEYQKPQNNEDI
jgi:hypothetical protein